MKTITIKKFEFERSLQDLINGADIPAFVIESVLKDAIAATHVAADKQLMADLSAYKNELEKEKKVSCCASE